MATRLIQKNGKVIPMDTDHGDQQQPQASHALPINPVANPATCLGTPDSHHPEPHRMDFHSQATNEEQ